VKISTQEVERIKRIASGAESHDLREPREETTTSSMTHIMESSSAPDVIHQVASIVDATPDVREEVIAAIKAKTATGAYRVSSEDIADLIVRRALADKVR
jgi:anti-sigma28 factor (negative regulator of flagellin synthesis)